MVYLLLTLGQTFYLIFRIAPWDNILISPLLRWGNGGPKSPCWGETEIEPQRVWLWNLFFKLLAFLTFTLPPGALIIGEKRKRRKDASHCLPEPVPCAGLVSTSQVPLYLGESQLSGPQRTWNTDHPFSVIRRAVCDKESARKTQNLNSPSVLTTKK